VFISTIHREQEKTEIQYLHKIPTQTQICSRPTLQKNHRQQRHYYVTSLAVLFAVEPCLSFFLAVVCLAETEEAVVLSFSLRDSSRSLRSLWLRRTSPAATALRLPLSSRPYDDRTPAATRGMIYTTSPIYI